jgi:hypothetical protein
MKLTRTKNQQKNRSGYLEFEDDIQIWIRPKGDKYKSIHLLATENGISLTYWGDETVIVQADKVEVKHFKVSSDEP